MKIAVLHYHLNRGGVTQVIGNHLAACAAVHGEAHGDVERVGIFYGGRRQGWSLSPEAVAPLEVSLHEIPELDYDQPSAAGGDPGAPLRAALAAAGFSAEETVLHVHNHSLGKNVHLPAALTDLAAGGYRLLLQIHDFAEDFRPGNYLRQAAAWSTDSASAMAGRLYPQAEQIHYAVLNRRDHSVLAAAGVAASRLHLLPNPVSPPAALPPRDEARAKLAHSFDVPPNGRFLLYPVRAIRRKNIGESLLWSAIGGDNLTVGVTLAPLNPLEAKSYHAWKACAAELDLPVRFELGGAAGLGYAENLAAADLLLTTSVAEGFGMVFLESWLLGRRLVGRDLPEISVDFAAAGLTLDGLQPQLWVPLEWVGRDDFVTGFSAAYADVQRRFGRDVPATATLQGEVQQLFDGDRVDFARLDSRLQRRVLQRVATSAAARDQVLAANRWMAAACHGGEDPSSLIAHNADVVRKNYSLQTSGQRLCDTYRAVADSGRGAIEPPPRGAAILDDFLSVARFYPIRIET